MDGGTGGVNLGRFLFFWLQSGWGSIFWRVIKRNAPLQGGGNKKESGKEANKRPQGTGYVRYGGSPGRCLRMLHLIVENTQARISYN